MSDAALPLARDVLLGLRHLPVLGTIGPHGIARVGNDAHVASGLVIELLAHDIPAGARDTCCRCGDTAYGGPALDGVNPGTGLARCFGCGGLFHCDAALAAASPSDRPPCSCLPCRSSSDQCGWV